MMNFEPLDRTNEPGPEGAPDEFEKLEFLPEQPAGASPIPDETAEIIFTPEDESADEPPVSFSPAEEEDSDLTFDPAPLPDLADSVPFELVGKSLFDDDLDPLEPDDFDDDLEF